MFITRQFGSDRRIADQQHPVVHDGRKKEVEKWGTENVGW